ncbi:GntR family transcriptional regulator [Kordiimonas aquimaris]|uniref:GntR family transcriptional regulator n=1 Tax=Kordiimonas aquimaris TaxID=707591 RepID=UPI0021D2B90B|nr:GntR family transcriptional regulator [Kordiimonas aquimaris]
MVEKLALTDEGKLQEQGSYIHEQVYGRLREALMAGELVPGRAISMRRLAAEFEVSAMPAREAIRRLVALGALELTPTRRVMISRMTKERLLEIKAARLALEPLLAEAALANVAKRVREKNKVIRSLEQSDALLDEAIRKGDVLGYSRFNRDFHFELYKASDATVILGLVESLWLQFGPFMRQVIGRLGTSCLIDDKHKEAVRAFKECDAERLKSAIMADIEHGMNTIDVEDAESKR